MRIILPILMLALAAPVAAKPLEVPDFQSIYNLAPLTIPIANKALNLAPSSNCMLLQGPPEKPAGHYCEINLMPSGFFVGTREQKQNGSYCSVWGEIVTTDDLLVKVSEWASQPKRDTLPKRLLLNDKEIWTDTDKAGY